MLNKQNLLLLTQDYSVPNDILENFCGQIDSFNEFTTENLSKYILVYICTNNDKIADQLNLTRVSKVIIIKESNLGEIPINIHNVGVYFKKFFNNDKNYYDSITSEHEFQILGISGKADEAYRKGIYLTKVEEAEEGLKFKLLRCSTNLNGPTDNFRTTDNEIIEKVNSVRHFFNGAELNHVLAQTYHNVNLEDGRQKKAKISEHSDKTKDMPKNGLIAFCTFYKDLPTQQQTDNDPFEYVYGKKETTILTKLRFRLKDEAAINNPNLEKQFDLTLYPNSVFLISLYINRLYTHKIIPSSLPIDNIPTRMGYIIRSSNTDAIFKDNQTYIVSDTDGRHLKLENPTKEGICELKKMYYTENATTDIVDYKGKFYFSMNTGDYMKPLI